MTQWIDWAFEQDLPSSEKLVLVHLASEVNRAGIGRWDRERLAHRCGYKKRSIQRLLKVLRDAGHLTDHGDWYLIGLTDADGGTYSLADLERLDDIDVEAAKPSAKINTGAPALDAEAIGEAVAKPVIDAGEYLIDQLANFEHRLAAEITRLVTFHVEPPPAPPPDPVTENPLYAQLLEQGIDEHRAYRLSQADLELEEPAAAPAPVETPPLPPGMEQQGPLTTYEDSPTGRFHRVLHLLHGDDWQAHDTAANRTRWQALEDAENKHTVAGETDAFELLYPAIVDAARRLAGRATIEHFTNLDAAANARAPWDVDPNPTAADDAGLEREIEQMLVELEGFNDPRCTVGPRTSERAADGKLRVETMLGYHRRVSAKLKEARKMKQMGMLG